MNNFYIDLFFVRYLIGICLMSFVSLIMLIDDQLGLANVDAFGQGNLEFDQGKVREKSGNFTF